MQIQYHHYHITIIIVIIVIDTYSECCEACSFVKILIQTLFKFFLYLWPTVSDLFAETFHALL